MSSLLSHLLDPDSKLIPQPLDEESNDDDWLDIDFEEEIFLPLSQDSTDGVVDITDRLGGIIPPPPPLRNYCLLIFLELCTHFV